MYRSDWFVKARPQNEKKDRIKYLFQEAFLREPVIFISTAPNVKYEKTVRNVTMSGN
jgi:hypothetical protein